MQEYIAERDNGLYLVNLDTSELSIGNAELNVLIKDGMGVTSTSKYKFTIIGRFLIISDILKPNVYQANR